MTGKTRRRVYLRPVEAANQINRALRGRSGAWAEVHGRHVRLFDGSVRVTGELMYEQLPRVHAALLAMIIAELKEKGPDQ